MLLLAALAAGCNQTTSLVSDSAGNDVGAGDAAAAGPLAPPSCVPGTTQCSNCLDDDGDGRIDGYDPHCLSPRDDREDSFETGLSGDNNAVGRQDCYFDGNSGSGDDGCRLHACCLLDLAGQACPFAPPPFDPSDCEVSQTCRDTCGPTTPPGCDCFGCCTVCADGNCFDVLTNPRLAPNCDLDGLADSSRCPACTKTDCGNTNCSDADCILCPGQRPEDLPAQCSAAACPPNLRACSRGCDDDQFCAGGCCVDVID